MKKLLILLILSFSILLPVSVNAKTTCDDLNNSKDNCNANSYCNWKWINESNGDGYCTLKSEFKDCNSLSADEKSKFPYCKLGCEYYVQVSSSNIEGGKATCTFNIMSGATNDELKISWVDKYSKDNGELNDYQVDFMCVNKSINFWNMNLPENKLQQTGLNSSGEEVGILDFKRTWNEKYNKNNACPKINFSSAGNYFVYFPDDQQEQPYNIGGIIDNTEDNPDIQKNDSDTTNEEKVSRCEVIPEAIKNYIIDALRLIRWIGLVAMIILGVLDFVKATASDDQDALKKAWQSFIKRLIAVIILFLLPILIELILYVAGLAGLGCENMPITDF